MNFNGLIANIIFTNSEPNISDFEICYVILNENYCTPFNRSETIFNGTNRSDFNFGQIYQFFVKSIGCGPESCEVDSNYLNITVGLDQVKLESNHPVNRYQNNLNLTFNSNLLPKPKYDYISIKCSPGQNTDNKVPIFNNCSNGTQNIVCNCNLLDESSFYSVSILTNKNNFDPVVVDITEPIRTSINQFNQTIRTKLIFFLRAPFCRLPKVK